MSEFYRDAQVRGAQAVLARLQTVVPDAVILGGWAIYLYARGQRSTDVDIFVDFGGLGRLRQEFGPALTKNNNLRNYELIIDRVEVDVFVEYLSNSGVAIEELIEPSRTMSGFRVINPEGLLVLKLCAWIDRQGRTKGDKDEADVLSLLAVTPIDWSRYRAIIAKAHGRYLALLPGAVARLVSSAEVRRTWQFIKVNGEATVTSTLQWKRLKEDLAAKVPRGV
ncbi:MAG: hypothetical protein ACYDCI_13425 [Candidatus Limnocylindrales bacterium]